jgi:hypothetical protein
MSAYAKTGTIVARGVLAFMFYKVFTGLFGLAIPESRNLGEAPFRIGDFLLRSLVEFVVITAGVWAFLYVRSRRRAAARH